MAYPAVTYTFTNGTTASATEVNQNFTDLINGLSDGTKDLSISALTVAGTASLNGAVNIGNATSDDIAVNGYITTALIPKTDDSYDLGTSALAWQDGYFDGAVYTDTISELTGAAGVTIDETKLKDGGVILKTGSEISDAGGKYVKIKGGDGSGAVASGYVGEIKTNNGLANTTLTTSGTGYDAGNITLDPGVWAIYANVAVFGSPTTFTLLEASISATTATIDTQFSTRDLSVNTANARRITCPVRVVRLTAASTTYYLSLTATHSGGTAPSVIQSDSQLFAIRLN
jgi:hypothetical protein